MPPELTLERARRVRVMNRIRPLLLHTPWYMFNGRDRLAADCHVWPSTIRRLMQHETNPSYALADTITRAFEQRMGVKITMREIFSTDGTFPTPCVCDLTPNCGGCFPPEAYDQNDEMFPLYRTMKPGDWCRYHGLSE